MRLFDSHAHLDHRRFADDLDAVLKRAKNASVTSILAAAFSPDPEKLAAPARLAERNPMIWASAGVHPHDAAGFNEEALEVTHQLVTTHPRVVAVGEIGLDYYYNLSPPDKQRKCFEAFLHLALDVGKPVIVHVRDAYEDAIRILRRADIGRVGGVIHCFSGEPDHARAFLDMGLYLSFTGILTFPKAEVIRKVAAEVPMDRVLIETDAPYLAPVPHRGKRAEPAHVAVTNRKLAELRELTPAETADATFDNTRTLFSIQDLQDRVGVVAYTLGDSVYLNITDRCNLTCRFCPKRVDTNILGYDLALKREPDLADLLEALDQLEPLNPITTLDQTVDRIDATDADRRDAEPPDRHPVADYDEVVFCGLGEPTLRLDFVKQVAAELRNRGARTIRLNTDGLASFVHDCDVPAELAGLIDVVSVSLNAADPETYARICPSKYGPRAHEEVCNFIRSARRNLPGVRATAVRSSGADMEGCRRLAADLGVPFHAR